VSSFDERGVSSSCLRSPNSNFYLDGEKSVCNFIKAVNGQDRKKFKGNDETGLINTQCSHVFVHSSVDMYLGER
jgi:hypothetical protein